MRGVRGRAAAALLVAAAVATAPGGAAAFVRSATPSGRPLAWRSGCIFLTPSSAGTVDVDGGPNDELAAFSRSVATWQAAATGCSYLELRLEAPREQEVGLDGINTLVFRDDRWARPAVDGEDEVAYDPQAAAITTLFFVQRPGEDDDGTVLDADIEVNAVDFRIEVDGQTADPDRARARSDAENTLTHELGHLIGLDHTCFIPGTLPERPTDDGGDEIPNCFPINALPAEARDATMFNFADPDETKKRDLTPDDAAGMCGAYPLAADPASCEVVDVDQGRKGCHAADGDDPSPLVAAAAALAFLLFARRRGSA